MGNTPPTSGDLRRAVLEAVRHHFDWLNVARLMNDALVREGLKFYVVSIDDTFQEATNNEVIELLHRALVLRSYDGAIAEFHAARVEPFPLAQPPLGDDAELDAFLQGLLDDDDVVMMKEGQLPAPPPPPAALPEGAVLLGPAEAHLPATSIVRHVVDQGICSYNRANMAVHLRHIMFLGEHRNDPRVLDLIERSLEYGYDAVEAEWGLLMNDA